MTNEWHWPEREDVTAARNDAELALEKLAELVREEDDYGKVAYDLARQISESILFHHSLIEDDGGLIRDIQLDITIGELVFDYNWFNEPEFNALFRKNTEVRLSDIIKKIPSCSGQDQVSAYLRRLADEIDAGEAP